jgi:hypothetical protein
MQCPNCGKIQDPEYSEFDCCINCGYVLKRSQPVVQDSSKKSKRLKTIKEKGIETQGKEPRKFPWYLLILASVTLLIYFAAIHFWYGVLFFIVAFLGLLALRLIERMTIRSRGGVVLEFCSLLASISIFVLTFFLFGVFATRAIMDTGSIFATVDDAIVSMAIFVFLTWPLFTWVHFKWRGLDQKGIYDFILGGPRRFVSWDEIERIEFKNENKYPYFFLRGKKATIQISGYEADSIRFAEFVQRNVPVEKWSSVSEELSNLALGMKPDGKEHIDQVTGRQAIKMIGSGILALLFGRELRRN